MTEKQNKSLTERFVENRKKFKKEMRILYIITSIGIFIPTFVLSYFLLDNFDKDFITNTIIISLILTTISGLSTFIIKPKTIFVFTILISILLSGIVKVI